MYACYYIIIIHWNSYWLIKIAQFFIITIVIIIYLDLIEGLAFSIETNEYQSITNTFAEKKTRHIMVISLSETYIRRTQKKYMFGSKTPVNALKLYCVGFCTQSVLIATMKWNVGRINVTVSFVQNRSNQNKKIAISWVPWHSTCVCVPVFRLFFTSFKQWIRIFNEEFCKDCLQ